MKKKGFTLVELLAVIVILGILISISTVAIVSIRNKQEAENRRNVFSNILTQTKLFIADHPERLSRVTNGEIKVEVYELIKGGYLDIDMDKYDKLIWDKISKPEGPITFPDDGYQDTNNSYRHVLIKPCSNNTEKLYYELWDLSNHRSELSWAKNKETVYYNDCGCMVQTDLSSSKICIGQGGTNNGNPNSIY